MLVVGVAASGVLLGATLYLITRETSLLIYVYILTVLSYVGAAVYSYRFTKRGGPLPVSPLPQELGNLTPEEFMQINASQDLEVPCLVVVTNIDESSRSPYCLDIYLNGSMVGNISNDGSGKPSFSITAYTSKLLNYLTGSSSDAARLPWSTRFEAIPGGRIEVFMRGQRFLPDHTRVYSHTP